MTQRNILVTGGAGFIGSAVVRRLVGRGHRVVNLDSLTYSGNLASLESVADAPNYRFVKADIADHDTVAPLLAEATVHPANASRLVPSTSPSTLRVAP